MPFPRSVKPPSPRVSRIAIDARTVLQSKTGDRTYTLNLIAGLQQIQASWQDEFAFDLLLDAPDTEGLLPQSAGFTTHIVEAKNSRLWTLTALPKWARSHRPDLVHVQYLRPGALPCPFVTTIHDMVWRVLPRTFPARDRAIMNTLMPISALTARRILTVSQSSKNGIARMLRVSPRKIDVTPNAVDARFFAPVSHSQIESLRQKYHLGSAPYILSVGVLQPRKNLPRLIEAFQKLQNQAQNARKDFPFQLVITGKSGWGNGADLDRQNPQIRFTGYVLDEELPALYAGATLFAYPSLYEGFGLPVIEAMAANCPVLTSNRSSLPEVTGDAGVKIDPYRVDSVAQGLELLLDDETLRTELGERGQIWAARFTTQNQAQATLESYRRALENS